MQLGVYGVIVFTTVIGAILLGWQGTISEAAVTAIFGAAVGFAGGAAAGQGAVYTAVNGKSVVTPQLIAEQGANVRTALVAAAGSPARDIEAAELLPVEPE